ncbi:MAG: FtsX-like permease family protein [Pirellulales bacterium]|nr:FtsX-like permease family protein [Pirellulales bacterium]
MLRFAIRSLAYHWRTNLAVALGVMAATAVLTGALVVGDSVRGSLRHLIVDRLGRIDSVLVAPRFFRTELADEIAFSPGFQNDFTAALPAIVLQGTLAKPDGSDHQHAGSVSVLGVGAEFWKFGRGGPQQPPKTGEIVLNQPLADELQVRPGDQVMLRLPQAADVPADSPLGRKSETIRSQRFTVSEIISAAGLGGFGLRPSQQAPLNAFTTVESLQRMVEVHGRVNAVIVASRSASEAVSINAELLLQAALHPTLADYGLSIRKTERGYFNLTTDRMVLEPAVEQAAMNAFGALGAQPAYTYLANLIRIPNSNWKVPYSTIAAVNFTTDPPLGPFVDLQSKPIAPLEVDEIVLNSWVAGDLLAQGAKLQPGDSIELTYFEPESTHGKVVESSHIFRLKDIVNLVGPADDRSFTPEVKGVTDEESIADWNPPFPYDSARVRSLPPHDEDDKYWKKYRATPKGFISLKQGRKLWGSRFGNTTSIRIPDVEISLRNRSSAASSETTTSKSENNGSVTPESLAKLLEQKLSPASVGFEFIPIKRFGLKAAAGTTPFAGLFLAFSFFIIIAALMLILLLFKLGVDSRAAELGIVLAVGWRRSAARWTYLLEGAVVAKVGALAGVVLGVGYAWLMLAGLKTWWLGAITAPFLGLYVAPTTLIIGYLSGLFVSLATIAWSLRQLGKVTVRRLLAGESLESRSWSSCRSAWPRWFAIFALFVAVACGLGATRFANESQSLLFLGSGALVLTAILVTIWNMLRFDQDSSLIGVCPPLVRLAIRNSSRFPMRSTLTIGLTATACFLIASLSAFQLAPSSTGPKFNSGDGGLALIAQSDQPIYQNMNNSKGRDELGFSQTTQDLFSSLEAGARIDRLKIFSLRVQRGDEASCLNLFQSRQPRILGLPEEFIERGGFAWAATLSSHAIAEASHPDQIPWRLLLENRDPDVIPVVIDQNTALYSLHLYGGVGQIFEIDLPRDGTLKLQVVGLLKNSIFQGDLLMSERNFLQVFPETSGYRMFLIESPPAKANRVAAALETNLGDYGFDTQATAARLADLFAVQNAYLAMFRSLGGLGLLLGTFGLATVQLRNVVERRGELALLRAAGFRRSRLVQMVMLENAWLLMGGLASGVIAALVALLPHLFAGNATIPWPSLAATLFTVLIVGVLAGLLAVRAVLKSPLLPALRNK